MFPELTTREREVLGHVAEGVDNPTIGRRLKFTSKTVANHVSNTLTKLQIGIRARAIVTAHGPG